MTFKTARELAEAGAVIVDVKRDATWNDGGRWNTRVYALPDGRFWQVHQPTDYVPDVELSEVRRVVTEVVTYEKIKESSNE